MPIAQTVSYAVVRRRRESVVRARHVRDGVVGVVDVGRAGHWEEGVEALADEWFRVSGAAGVVTRDSSSAVVWTAGWGNLTPPEWGTATFGTLVPLAAVAPRRGEAKRPR